jgi:hypothetical protein
MTEGKQEHEMLYEKFAAQAVPATVEQILTESQIAHVSSREFRVEDVEHGLYGYIDEVWFTPEDFVVIDDKPGSRAYLSNIHQILGYCLAFKTVIAPDRRRLIAALRERGTENIFWQSPFDSSAEEEITLITNHMHDLLFGKVDFKPSGNPNKCRSCRLKPRCDKCSL